MALGLAGCGGEESGGAGGKSGGAIGKSSACNTQIWTCPFEKWTSLCSNGTITQGPSLDHGVVFSAETAEYYGYHDDGNYPLALSLQMGKLDLKMKKGGYEVYKENGTKIQKDVGWACVQFTDEDDKSYYFEVTHFNLNLIICWQPNFASCDCVEGGAKRCMWPDGQPFRGPPCPMTPAKAPKEDDTPAAAPKEHNKPADAPKDRAPQEIV